MLKVTTQQKNILLILLSLILLFLTVLISWYFILKISEKITHKKIIRSHEERVFSNYKSKVFGLDISHYQGRIDWKQVKQFNNGVAVSFVFIRAAIGKDEEDQRFAVNWKNAKKRGIIRGAYHYYRPDENSIEQADNFISIVKLEKGDLPPVLDIEAVSSIQTVKSLKIGLKKWLKKVEKHFKIKPIIYTGDSYYKDFLNDTAFRKYTFWIANYNKIKQPKHRKWKIWQFSKTGRIKGIDHDVDFNVFRGSLKELQKMTIK